MDWAGNSVSAAGDVNNDGFDDLIIGAPGVDRQGAAYVLFGRAQFDLGGRYFGLGTWDNVEGTARDDLIQGRGGNDTLTGGSAGADTLDGGLGIDTADYTAANAVSVNLATGVMRLDAAGDVLILVERLVGSAAGNDVLVGRQGKQTLEGLGGNDRLDGGQGADVLIGGGGSDRLIGRAGADMMNGASGNDRLEGFSGNDRMTGGAGADNFLFSHAVFGQDTVNDFEDGLDRLWFSRTLADFALAGNGTTDVTVSVIGNPGQSIALHGATPITLTAADFVFFG